MAIDLQTPAFQALSPEVAANLSPEAIERHTRLACLAHLAIDFGLCLAKDLEDPDNQRESALGEAEFAQLALSILQALDKLSLCLVSPLAPYVAACQAPQVGPTTLN